MIQWLGERESFSTAISQQRYQRSIESFKKEWSGRRCSFITAVDVVGRVGAPFCLGVLKYPMFGSADEEAKIIKQVVMSFLEGFRLSSYYRSASAVFLASNFECPSRVARGC